MRTAEPVCQCMKRFWTQACKGGLSWLSPPLCWNCSVFLSPEESFICDSCRQEIHLGSEVECASCGRSLADRQGQFIEEDALCVACQGLKSSERFPVRAFCLNQGAARDWVLALKYGGEVHWARFLAQCLVEKHKEIGFCAEESSLLVTSVPQTLRSRWTRGYNQAELIAQGFAREKKLAYRPLFEKKWGAKSLTSLSKEQRALAIEGSMKARSYLRVHGASLQAVLLIDDVYTTGSTMRECARLLRKYAPQARLYGLTFLRGQ